jgi:hypothetical protein
MPLNVLFADIANCCLRRFNLVSPDDVQDIQYEIDANRLNTFYDFVGYCLDEQECAESYQGLSVNDNICLQVQSLGLFLRSFNFFTVEHLMSLCLLHQIGFSSYHTKNTLRFHLINHSDIECNEICDLSLNRVHYTFSRMSRRRTRLGTSIDDITAQIGISHMENLSSHQNIHDSFINRRRKLAQTIQIENESQLISAYASVSTSQLKEVIVREWQTRFRTDYYGCNACSVCSLSELKSGTKFEWHSVSFEVLELLQNDHIPNNIMPDTYCLDAYNHAILNPKGIANHDELDDILLCKKCASDLLDKNQMPDLAMANWLYYAHSRLPPDINSAFKESSVFERMLIARCSASRIIHRFSDKQDSPVYGQPSISSQRYSQGNTICLPQDSVGLNKCLPPNPDTVRDTMCALYVGQEKPTRDNIVRLSPVLIRRSRLKSMISFLLDNNTAYAITNEFTGFSQTNLDALFRPGDSSDAQVPAPIQEEFLLSSPAVNSTVSAGITDRDNYDRDGDRQYNNDVLMENVGYTDGDFSTASYQKMKVDALSYCLKGGTYIRSQRGLNAVPDFYNPSLLTWLFPHLDPYGIGGFYEPRRKRKISMDKQLKHLILTDDSLFERDSNFAFIFYNIIQKREVVKSANFRVRQGEHINLVHSLTTISHNVLDELSNMYKTNPRRRPDTDEQNSVLRSLEKLKLVCRDLPGSAAYKQCRRNEIRALINRFGSPALFVTINPSDVNHPLVRLLAGDDINLEDATVGEELDMFQRKIKVANNPASAALFFDSMITQFLEIILRWNRGQGALGACKAYYGMVEAQGKGTLHCHMLIWLHGHLSPLALRDKMQSDPEFKEGLFSWLESIIKCELPGTQEVVPEGDDPLDQPARTGPHPTLTPAPTLPEGDGGRWEIFEESFLEFVTKIVIENNWHVHNATCWKLLKPGEKHDDAHCRMRMNGQTNPYTHLDPETRSIMLRRLHPRISNYNEMISFLLKCNNDIKFIGSGEAAQALVFYITDYITKTSLTTHAGLAALAYAVRRDSEQFETCEFSQSRAKSLVTKAINAMMSRQELSHQQIMSYIVGGGDCYKSHSFSILHWGSFDKIVDKQLRGDPQDIDRHQISRDLGELDDETLAMLEGQDLSECEQDPPQEDSHDLLLSFHNAQRNCSTALQVNINGDAVDDDENEVGPDQRGSNSQNADGTFEDGQSVIDPEGSDGNSASISASNQQIDYLCRSRDPQFDQMCLYDFVAKVAKMSKRSEDRRQSNPNHHRSVCRGALDPDHPQHSSHLLRLRHEDSVPVILGPSIPRRALSDGNRERWARAMLVLFKPWRMASDLKSVTETWFESYSRNCFSERHSMLMKNMEVLSECKDARDADMAQRRLNREGNLMGIINASGDMDSLASSLQQDGHLDLEGWELGQLDGDHAITIDEEVPLDDAGMAVFHLNAANIPLADLSGQAADGADFSSRVTNASIRDLDLIKSQAELMQKLRTKRRPAEEPSNDAESNPRQRRRLDQADASGTTGQTSLDTLGDVCTSPHISDRLNADQNLQHSDINDDSNVGIIEQLIAEQGMSDNPEQARALRIIGKHVLEKSSEQLLMYISGVGGTGKSHVISSVHKLFHKLGRDRELLLSAPTGIAAVLIGGYTIHALTYLPKTKQQKSPAEKLHEIWRHARYLVIDEVSMISAQFLAQISAQLNLARQCPSDCGTMFGNISVIFTGDMGQLKPVKALSLFSHLLVNDLRIETAQSAKGQDMLYGTYLWRQVTHVIELQKNMRQSGDQMYASLLNRVRMGHATSRFSHLSSGGPSDVEIIANRELGILKGTCQDLSQFKDAPVIVGTKAIRDAINRVKVVEYAQATRQELFEYCSKDRISMVDLSGELRQRAWRIRSSVSKDSMGKIPMVPGMKVMVTENIAIQNKIVNGSEGTLHSMKYKTDDDGNRYLLAAYIHVPGSALQSPGCPLDVVPILPVRTGFTYQKDKYSPTFYISRLQVPLVPAYCYTDYKSQGRSLQCAVVDLASARSLQGVYVMLSRVKSLGGLAILRSFEPKKIDDRLAEEMRNEFQRLSRLAELTKSRVTLDLREPVLDGI